MNRMVLMIHIPDSVDICNNELIKQIRSLLSICGESMKLCNEHWQLNFDDEDRSTVSYTYDSKTQERWENGLEKLGQNRLAQITAVLYYLESGVMKKNSIGVTAVLLSHTEHYKLPRENGERWLSIRIPLCLWKHVNQIAFIQATKDACIALRATYACIDEEAPIGGIYECWFLELANDSETVKKDVESKLPGIYWCQLMHERMVEQTGVLEEIVKSIPFGCTEILECDNSRMLWVEITDDIRKATHKKRLAMRRFFESSLNQISIDKAYHFCCTNWASLPFAPPFVVKHILKCMKRIPLSDDEINVIMRMKA